MTYFGIERKRRSCDSFFQYVSLSYLCVRYQKDTCFETDSHVGGHETIVAVMESDCSPLFYLAPN